LLKGAAVNPLQRDQVISAFPEEERQDISLPAFDRLQWSNLDFLGWCDRSGDKAFLVFEADGEASGLMLDRMPVHTSRARSFMCSICRTMTARALSKPTCSSARTASPEDLDWSDN